MVSISRIRNEYRDSQSKAPYSVRMWKNKDQGNVQFTSCVQGNVLLRKIPYFYLISWRGNFVERHSFRMKLCGNCAFPQNFHTRKLCEVTVFFVVLVNEMHLKFIKNVLFDRNISLMSRLLQISVQWTDTVLTYSQPMFHLYNPWNTGVFLMFSGSIKTEHWLKMGQYKQ